MKTVVSDLAVLGGPPMFREPLHVGRPNLYNREALFHRLGVAVDRLWFTNDGPLLLEMEETFARFFGVRHCVAVANATLGLLLVAHALRLKGDVLIPPLLSSVRHGRSNGTGRVRSSATCCRIGTRSIPPPFARR